MFLHINQETKHKSPHKVLYSRSVTGGEQAEKFHRVNSMGRKFGEILEKWGFMCGYRGGNNKER